MYQGVTFTLGEEEIHAKNASEIEDVFQTSLRQVRRREKRFAPPKLDDHYFNAFDCSEPVLHSVIRQKKSDAILCDHQNRSLIAEEKTVASILQAVSWKELT